MQTSGYKAVGFNWHYLLPHDKTTTYTGYVAATVHETIISTSPGTGSSLGLICTDSFDPDSPPSDYDYAIKL